MRIAIAGAVIALGAIFSGTPVSSAQPVTPTCEKRAQSHYDRHGGLWKDSLEHVAMGELPTCGAEERAVPTYGEDDPDSKSRFCRKRWYC